ncbi:MAG: Gfo/Idh/MocA family protein [Christensenellales bacterium]|jgi:1,5-anhydro-D-fructose reductase (1,5-anhydro-D-mannitol-forming)
MVKVLMLSKWHVHQEGYANDVNKQPDAKVTCVWDTDVQRGQEWAGRLGAAFEADLDKALSRSDVDAVVVGTPTTAHREVIIKAAQHGKHIFTEKALATTMEDCRAIADAVEKSGVKFVISYPQLTNPLVQLCKQAIAENWLGDIHYMRMRVAHDGASRGWLPAYWYNAEDAGGGAMMDLGCHPMYTASYLLGKPRRITSMFNNTHAPNGVDDNAVSVVEFENKAIAVLETSFVSPHQANCFELLGTQGAIVQVDGKVRIHAQRFGDGWFTPDKLPAALPMPMRMWLDAITQDAPIVFDMERALALTELLENAYIADREQRIVSIP